MSSKKENWPTVVHRSPPLPGSDKINYVEYALPTDEEELSLTVPGTDGESGD